MRRQLRAFAPVVVVVVALFGACVAAQSLMKARFVATVTARAPVPQSECVSRFESFGYSEMTAREELCAPGLHGTWYHAVVRNVGHSSGNPYCTLEGRDPSGRVLVRGAIALGLLQEPAGPNVAGGGSESIDYFISEKPLHVDNYVADCRNRTGNQIPV